jgi:hypothetical protein
MFAFDVHSILAKVRFQCAQHIITTGVREWRIVPSQLGRGKLATVLGLRGAGPVCAPHGQEAAHILEFMDYDCRAVVSRDKVILARVASQCVQAIAIHWTSSVARLPPLSDEIQTVLPDQAQQEALGAVS